MSTVEMTFSSFNELLNAVLPNGSVGQKLDGYVFRGEGSGKYKLLPSALREENIENLKTQVGNHFFKLNDTEWLQVFTEYQILRNFYRISNNSGLKVHATEQMAKHYFDATSPEFVFNGKPIAWINSELVELAALAQHYGALTRMLDWSNDLLVALYFACTGAMKKYVAGESDNMVIWALDASGIQVNEQHIYTIGEDTCPLKLVVPSYYSNANLKAQKGVLSYWRIWARREDNKVVDRTPIDELIQTIPNLGRQRELLYKFELPNKYAIDTYRWLRSMGVSAAMIYPGYRGVVLQMEENALFEKALKNS